MVLMKLFNIFWTEVVGSKNRKYESIKIFLRSFIFFTNETYSEIKLCISNMSPDSQ